MRLHIIKHVVFEGPGAIATWAGERGHTLRTTELEAGEALPCPDDFDALVLMGGPMSVNEEDVYPWLRPEKALVRETLSAGKKILGVCLGSQMIASALGAKVYRNGQKEIGFFPITSTPEARLHPFFRRLPPAFSVFHWHGETFDLPPGALLLARSEACAHQAYALGGQVLALQCHIEVDARSLKEMVQGGEGELEPGKPYIQSAESIMADKDALGRLGPLCRILLDDWLAL